MLSRAETDEHDELLSSPLGRAGLGRAFVFGGPAGLLVSIMLSLWVSHWSIRNTSVVQVDTQWVAGERLAMRAEVTSTSGDAVGAISAKLWVEQAGERFELPAPQAAGPAGAVQTSFQVPALAQGSATLNLWLEVEGDEAKIREIPLEVVARREPIKPTVTVSQSTLQYADDSDPQPAGLRINIRPQGKLVPEFDNVVFVRVLHPDGRPYFGLVEVDLVRGRFGDKRAGDNPVLFARTSTDAAGLIALRGLLTSAALGLDARVLTNDDPPKVLAHRMVRMVGHAGGVTVHSSLRSLRPGDKTELSVAALRRKRPVFVDIHGPDGAFIDTLSPAPRVGTEAVSWQVPPLPNGVVHFEAYHFTFDPGESTGLERVQVNQSAQAKPAYARLVTAQLDRVAESRIEREYDAELERAYLKWLTSADLSAVVMSNVREYLVGTLPVEVFGPPMADNSREQEYASLAATKSTWMLWLRVYTLGGGGLFLMLLTVTMVRTQAAAARATIEQLRELDSDELLVDSLDSILVAKRAAIWRGLAVIAVMALGLGMITMLLQRLVWVF